MALHGVATFLLKARASLAASGDYGGGQTANLDYNKQYASGTAASQGDGLLLDTRTLAGTTAEDLDLQSLLDANGAALAAVEVVCLVLTADAANGDAIWVKPSVSNGWTAWMQSGSVLTLEAGAAMSLGSTADGAYPVSGSSKAINLDNQDSGAATYQIWALTRSA